MARKATRTEPTKVDFTEEDVVDATSKPEIDPDKIEEAIAEEIKAQEAAAATPATGPSQGELAQAILALTQSQKAFIDAQPVKKVPFAKVKSRSPFNPTGRRGRKLLRRCFQNGYRMPVDKLHDEEISLLNQIQPGRYINGLVVVKVQEVGMETDLHIMYKNKTIDQRLANKGEWRDLREMLRRILSEGPTDSRVRAGREAAVE